MTFSHPIKMNLSTQTQNDSGRETLLLVDSFYTIAESGYGVGSMPLIHLCGRNTEGERRVVTVEGFRPRFFVSKQEFVQNRDTIEKQLQKRSSPLIDYGQNHRLMDGRDQIDGVMLVCELPSDVKDLREEFERHWEADIQFTDVFKLEKEITDTISIPRGVSEVHHSEVRAEPSADIHERVCTLDIEVRSDKGFPDSDTPTQEVTAITAHDSYTDEYWSGVLKHESWSDSDVEQVRSIDNADTVTLYTDDKSLLYDFLEYMSDIQPDIVSHWNGDEFDMPYLVNRCHKLNVGGLANLSPTKDVRWIDGSVNHAIKGLLSMDMMKMYQAVTIHEEQSYGLDYIAQNVLGRGKEEMDEIDDAWKRDPQSFLEYNIRDVECVVELMDETDALTDFRGRRELTGCRMDKVNHPKNGLDLQFLAHGRGYVA